MTDQTTAPETTENTEAKAEKKVKAPVTLFLTSKYTPDTTVFGWLRRQVADNGGSMDSEQLSKVMLEQYQPKTSKAFGPSYVRAYIRGSVKEGYLAESDQGVTDFGSAPVKESKKAAEGEKASKPTKAGQEILDAMAGHYTEDNVGEWRVTVKDLADELKKNPNATGKAVAKLEKDGFAATKVDGDDTFVQFTTAGWNAAAKPAADEDEQTEGADGDSTEA